MSKYDPLNAETDCFHPPAIPILVGCLHCGEEYESYLIEWRIETNHEGNPRGFWCCPTPNCGGVGFGCDIFPCDPEYRDDEGNLFWTSDDSDDSWFEDDDLDEMLQDDSDDPPAEKKNYFDDDSISY